MLTFYQFVKKEKCVVFTLFTISAEQSRTFCVITSEDKNYPKRRIVI